MLPFFLGPRLLVLTKLIDMIIMNDLILFLILKKKVYIFSPSSMILAVDGKNITRNKTHGT